MQEFAFPGFKFQKFSGGICVVCRPHDYPPLIYYFTERSLFKKCPLPPTGKSFKIGPDKISNKVVYVHCVSKAVGQTNTVPPPAPPPPPPPQTRLGPLGLSLSTFWALFLVWSTILHVEQPGALLRTLGNIWAIFHISSEFRATKSQGL
jgi:hypothetical protein